MGPSVVWSVTSAWVMGVQASSGAAVAAGAARAGDNWSPLLRGAGGRGFAPSLGALGVSAWPGIPLMLGGLVAGKAANQTGLGGFAAQCALVPVLTRTHGRRGAMV